MQEPTITANPGYSNVRPMLIGEILDGGFSIYRRHFGLFMRLSIVLIGIPAVVSVYVASRFIANPVGATNWLQEHIAATIAVGLLAGLLWMMIFLLLSAGTIRIISDSYLGNEPTLGAALRLGVERSVQLLIVAIGKALLMLVVYIGVVIAVVAAGAIGRAIGVSALFMVLAVLAGCWALAYVLCVYGLTSMVVVLEELDSSFDAFGRSAELTRQSRLKVFLIWLVIWAFTTFLPYIVIFGLSLVFGPESPAQPFLSLGMIIMGVILAPILPCAFTLLYYDLRVRREAFDLQILSDQLGTR